MFLHIYKSKIILCTYRLYKNENQGGEKLSRKILAIALLVTFISLTLGTATASEVYDISKQIVMDAKNKLNIDNNSQCLVITTAGSARYKNENTVDGIQAVVDHMPSARLGKGNILTLYKYGNLEFTFVKKEDKELYAIKYYVDDSGIKSTPKLNIGFNIDENQFNVAKNYLGYDTITIAWAWASGAPPDLLEIATTTWSIRPQTIADYAITKHYIANFNPSETILISKSGNYDDDAALHLVGNRLHAVYKYEGPDDEKVFIAYDYPSCVVVHYKEKISKTRPESLEELKEMIACIEKLKTNPSSLFSIKYLKTGNSNDAAYLAKNGIDENYISKLNNANIELHEPKIAEVNYDKYYNLGKEIFNKVYKVGLFTTEDINAGKVTVVLPPYYSVYSGTNEYIAGLIDGIIDAAKEFGAVFPIRNIFQIDNKWYDWIGSQISIIFAKSENERFLTTNKLEDLKIQGVFVTIKSPKIEVSEIRDISPANDPSPVAKYGFEDPLKMIFAWSMGSPYEYLWIYQRSGRSYTWEDYDIVLALEPWKINDGNLILIAPIGEWEWSSDALIRVIGYGVSPSRGTYFSYTITQPVESLTNIYRIIVIGIPNTIKLITYDKSKIAKLVSARGFTCSIGNQLYRSLYLWNNKEDSKDFKDAIFTTEIKQISIEEILKSQDPVALLLAPPTLTPTPTPSPIPTPTPAAPPTPSPISTLTPTSTFISTPTSISIVLPTPIPTPMLIPAAMPTTVSNLALSASLPTLPTSTPTKTVKKIIKPTTMTKIAPKASKNLNTVILYVATLTAILAVVYGITYLIKRRKELILRTEPGK